MAEKHKDVLKILAEGGVLLMHKNDFKGLKEEFASIARGHDWESLFGSKFVEDGTGDIKEGQPVAMN